MPAPTWGMTIDDSTGVQDVAFQNMFVRAFREKLMVLGRTADAQAAGFTNAFLPGDLMPATFSPTNPDAARGGDWLGTLGFDGYKLFNAEASLPSYVSGFTTSGNSLFVWDAAPAESRALRHAAGGGRIAATAYSATSFTINFTVTGGHDRYVSLYMVDWDGGDSRKQSATVGAAVFAATKFSGGVWYTFRVPPGPVTITIQNTSGTGRGTSPQDNAVVSGVFFDTPGDNVQWVGSPAQPNTGPPDGNPWARVGTYQRFILDALTCFANPSIDPASISHTPDTLNRLSYLGWMWTPDDFFAAASVLKEPGPIILDGTHPRKMFRRKVARCVDSWTATADLEGNTIADGQRAYVLQRATGLPSGYKHTNEIHVRRGGAWVYLTPSDADWGPVDCLDTAAAAPDHAAARPLFDSLSVLRGNDVDNDYLGPWLYEEVRACFNLMKITSPPAAFFIPDPSDPTNPSAGVVANSSSGGFDRQLVTSGSGADASSAAAIADAQAQVAAGADFTHWSSLWPWLVTATVRHDAGRPAGSHWSAVAAIGENAVPYVGDLDPLPTGTMKVYAFSFGGAPPGGAAPAYVYDAQGTGLSENHWALLQTVAKPAVTTTDPTVVLLGSNLWPQNTNPPNWPAAPGGSTLFYDHFEQLGFASDALRGWIDWSGWMTYL